MLFPMPFVTFYEDGNQQQVIIGTISLYKNEFLLINSPLSPPYFT